MDDPNLAAPAPEIPAAPDEFEAQFHAALEPLTHAMQHQMLRIEARLNGLESDLQLLHQRLNQMVQRLEKLEGGGSQTLERVTNMEAVVADLRSSRVEGRAEMEILQQRLAGVTRTEPTENG